MRNKLIASAVFSVVIMTLGCVTDQGSKRINVVENVKHDGSAYNLPQEDIMAVFHKAYAATQLQGPQSELRIVDQAKTDWGYVTFVGFEDRKIVFVVFTEDKFRSPSTNLWIGTVEGKLPHGATLDWAYVFDRNHDGKVDYFAFLDGPSPVVPGNWNDNLPKVNGPLGEKDIEIIINNIEPLFWHMADDNYDGYHDGVVVSLRNLDTGWIDGSVVARDTDFDGSYDSCKAFRGRLQTDFGECEGSHATFHVSNKEFSGLKEIPPPRGYFTRINDAAEKCHITWKFFYGSEESTQ